MLDAGADDGGIGAQQRHGLALHVRTHQRTIGVVVLEERNQRGRDTDHLLGRDVHVVDFGDVHVFELATVAARDFAGTESTGFVYQGVGLGDGVFLFFVGRDVFDIA